MEQNVTIVVAQQRQFPWFPILAVIALAATYWQWTLPIVFLAVVAYLLYRRAITPNPADVLRARAEQQDAWVYEGDPRGTYGHDYQEVFDGQEVRR